MNALSTQAGRVRQESQPRLPWWAGIPMAAVCSLFLVLFELTKAHRINLWAGSASLNGWGIAAGFGVYFAAILAIAVLISALDYVARRLVPSYLSNAVLVVGAAALTVWLAAASCASELRGSMVFAVAAALAGIDLCYWLTRRVWFLTGIFALSLAGGIAALISANHAFFLHENRVGLITAVMGAWAGIAALVAATSLRGFRRVSLRAASAGVLLVLLFVGVPMVAAHVYERMSRPTGPSTGPNVVFVVCDALRADCMSLHGGPVSTPGFETLATRGARFAECRALAPWTLPSMLGMLSSQYPPSTSPGASEEEYLAELERYRLTEDMTTLAERLLDQGYATAAFVANPLINDPSGMLRGFVHTGAFGFRLHVRTGLFDNLPVLQDTLFRILPSSVQPRPADTTEILLEYGRQYARHHQRQPFFLYLHLMDPHGPYAPPDRFRATRDERAVFCPSDPYWNAPPIDAQGDIIVPDEEKPSIRALYDGEVRYVDETIARLAHALDALGLAQSTILCVVSDHGEEFWEHGRQGHGQSLYDELLWVPWVVAGPGVTPGTEIAAPVSCLDVMPTLAGLLGVSGIDEWRGRNLSPALSGKGESAPPVPCFSQATNPIVAREPLQMAVWQGHKLIRGLHTGAEMLFDLAGDPAEQAKCTAEKPAEAAELRRLLDEWSASFPCVFTPASGVPSEDAPTDEVVQRIRDAGYL